MYDIIMMERSEEAEGVSAARLVFTLEIRLWLMFNQAALLR